MISPYTGSVSAGRERSAPAQTSAESSCRGSARRAEEERTRLLTVAVAGIIKIDRFKTFLQTGDDGVEGAKSVDLGGVASIVGEGHDGVVDDDADLLGWRTRGALQNLDLDLSSEGDDSACGEHSRLEGSRRRKGAVEEGVESHRTESVEDGDLVSGVGL